MRRRGFILGASALTLAACSGVRPYKNVGTGNLSVSVEATDSNWWTQRGAAIDIWTGPQGPNMEYLGTRDIPLEGTVIGLPTGRPLHMILVFEEGSFIGGYDSATSIQLPMKPLSSRDRWRLVVSNTQIGYDYDLKRVR